MTAKLKTQRSITESPARMILYARRIVTPLTVFRCPTHSNYALAGMVGLMGRNKEGNMAVERMV